MDTLTIAVDGLEWDSLYEDPSEPESRHKIREGKVLQIQLWTSSNRVLHHWNRSNSVNQFPYLGIVVDDQPERSIVTLRKGSNLAFFSGYAKRIVSRPRKLDPRKDSIDILVDCGIPLVIMDEVERGSPSRIVEEENQYVVGICHLWGSIAFSNSIFQAPVVGKARKITSLRVTPPSVMLDIELRPPQVLPETMVSYHARPLVKVDTVPHLTGANTDG